jgi:exodeoxyribonuclease VII large subunit
LLQTSPQATLHRQHDRLREMRHRLSAAIRHDMAGQRPRLSNLWQRLHNSSRTGIEKVQHRLALAMRGLHSVSPLATLERGYAIVEDTTTGKVLLRASDASPGDDIRARLSHGELTAKVTTIKDESQ